jgi:hypothetical protein
MQTIELVSPEVSQKEVLVEKHSDQVASVRELSALELATVGGGSGAALFM